MQYMIHGPFEIDRNERGRVERKKLPNLWAKVEEVEEGLSYAYGCYFFCIQNKILKPWYVGKTISGFRTECFQHHKLNLYTEATDNKGRPVLFLLPRRTPKGKLSWQSTGAAAIEVSSVESLLIGMGLSCNPSILNVRGTKLLRQVQIPGVLNSPRGRPNRAVSAFADAFSL
ncbi:MAG: hypothetical protein O3B22_10395 [Proteobacteria bacterium]|nr:hypothetical protein [Pseudomonadota bacterium]MDA1070982.1 hypothetical protein [Pseudomonadota bacterium]